MLLDGLRCGIANRIEPTDADGMEKDLYRPAADELAQVHQGPAPSSRLDALEEDSRLPPRWRRVHRHLLEELGSTTSAPKR